jgi:hypothetical protein
MTDGVGRAEREIGRRGRSGGVVSRHFDDLDAVLEFEALDDFRKPVFAPPCLRGGADEFEPHEFGGRRPQRSFVHTSRSGPSRTCSLESQHGHCIS